MKKLLSILIMAIIAATTTSAEPVDARRQKQLQRECNSKIKHLQNSGWQLLNSSASLESAVQAHYDKLAQAGNDALEVYGTASKAKDKASGVNAATNNAAKTYAQQQSSDLKNRVVSELSAESGDPSTSMDKFFVAYENAVEKEIKGSLTPSYQLFLANPDGTFEIEVDFIVSEKNASAARTRAFEATISESEAAKRYADQISQFVKSGYNN